jgi:hypothetical protein
MKVGIIGSRERNSRRDKILVFDTVCELIKTHNFSGLHLVSGGCSEGGDFFAEEAAKYFGVSMTIHYPQKLPKPKDYSETVDRFYKRNDKVAEDSDVIYALVSVKRKGGTEYTINKMKSLKKLVYII